MPSVDLHMSEHASGGSVGTIVVDNPEKLNILNSPLIEELLAVLKELDQEDNLRVAVLRGAGSRAFIGGADIREMVSLNEETAKGFIQSLHLVCAGLRGLAVPVVARIEGYCLGAGLEVAASCDLRIAAEGASFGMPEVRVGIPSVIEAALLPQLIGWGRTRELVFTGSIFDAQEVYQWGLVEAVVPASKLDDAVAERVDAICACGPEAIRLQKGLIAQWEGLPAEQAIEAGVEVFASAYRGSEPRTLMQRFLDEKGSKS